MSLSETGIYLPIPSTIVRRGHASEIQASGLNLPPEGLQALAVAMGIAASRHGEEGKLVLRFPLGDGRNVVIQIMTGTVPAASGRSFELPVELSEHIGGFATVRASAALFWTPVYVPVSLTHARVHNMTYWAMPVTLASVGIEGEKPTPPAPVPVIDSVTPAQALAGATVTISGSHLGGPLTKVYVGDYGAVVIDADDDEITFEAPDIEPGTYDVSVMNTDGIGAHAFDALEILEPDPEPEE